MPGLLRLADAAPRGAGARVRAGAGRGAGRGGRGRRGCRMEPRARGGGGGRAKARSQQPVRSGFGPPRWDISGEAGFGVNLTLGAAQFQQVVCWNRGRGTSRTHDRPRHRAPFSPTAGPFVADERARRKAA
jgi:hypothetical protein